MVEWSIDKSLFSQRKKENDAHDTLDTDKVRFEGCSCSWGRRHTHVCALHC